MDRFIITIAPPPSDESLLGVADAMQQVIDALNIFIDAERSFTSPHEAFEWKLESATTNSPFTVVAVAHGLDSRVDISGHVGRVKSAVASGLRNLIERGERAPWMDSDAIERTKALFARNQNGIAATIINFDDAAEPLTIDPGAAGAALRAIEGITAINMADLPERVAFGEIEGVMIAAGRYRNRPLVEKFGGEHQMADVWRGNLIGVRGRLRYAAGGKLSLIEALEIREITTAPPIDLASVLDPDFTAGLDPIEYLRQLHEGELA